MLHLGGVLAKSGPEFQEFRWNEESGGEGVRVGRLSEGVGGEAVKE